MVARLKNIIYSSLTPISSSTTIKQQHPTSKRLQTKIITMQFTATLSAAVLSFASLASAITGKQTTSLA
jgi:hypothetical protein